MQKSIKSISYKLLVVIVFVLMNIKCTNQSQAKIELWNFDSIQLNNELYLIQTDDKFGEWGGDTYLFRIYRSKQTNKLLIDYIEYKGKAGPPTPPDQDSELKFNWHSGQPKLFEKYGITTNAEYLSLISNAVSELIKSRVNNNEVITMSGVVNRVMYSDSTLIIEDYPSNNWNEFHILKNKVKNE